MQALTMHEKFISILFFCSVFFTATCQSVNNVQTTPLVNEFIFTESEFASCHASTIVAVTDNRLIAAWFGGPYESHREVSVWMAVRSEGRWGKPFLIADGRINDTLRYACWNPVLFKNGEGRLFLFYKVGRSPREWWGMMKQSGDEGRSWSAGEKLPDGFLGPIKNKPFQLANGNILHPSSTESLDGKSWKIHIEQSDSKAKQWKRIQIDCDTFGVIQPSILRYAGNRLQLLCRSRQNYIVESWSSDNGNTWSPLKKTQLANPNSGSDAVTLSNGMQLLVYNPLAAGREWYQGRHVLKVAVSPDGKNWKDIHTLEDHTSGEYSYPAVIQTNDNLVHITYTHERKLIRYVVLKVE
jgi:predicted neuraminidase